MNSLVGKVVNAIVYLGANGKGPASVDDDSSFMQGVSAVLAWIINLLSGIWSLIGNVVMNAIYLLVKFALNIVDFFQFFVGKLVGMNTWETGSMGDKSLAQSDVIFRFLTNERVWKVFLAIMGLSIVLLIIFSIISIVRQEYASTINEKESNNKWLLIRKIGRSLVLFLTVPIMVIFGILGSNAVLAGVSSAFKLGSGITLGGQIFVASAYEANRYRSYADEDRRYPMYYRTVTDVVEVNDNHYLCLNYQTGYYEYYPGEIVTFTTQDAEKLGERGFNVDTLPIYNQQVMRPYIAMTSSFCKDIAGGTVSTSMGSKSRNFTLKGITYYIDPTEIEGGSGNSYDVGTYTYKLHLNGNADQAASAGEYGNWEKIKPYIITVYATGSTEMTKAEAIAKGYTTYTVKPTGFGASELLVPQIPALPFDPGSGMEPMDGPTDPIDDDTIVIVDFYKNPVHFLNGVEVHDYDTDDPYIIIPCYLITDRIDRVGNDNESNAYIALDSYDTWLDGQEYYEYYTTFDDSRAISTMQVNALKKIPNTPEDFMSIWNTLDKTSLNVIYNTPSKKYYMFENFVTLRNEYYVMADVIDYAMEWGEELYFVPISFASNLFERPADYSIDRLDVTGVATYLCQENEGLKRKGFFVNYIDETDFYEYSSKTDERYGATFVVCRYSASSQKFIPLTQGNSSFKSSHLASGYKGMIVARGLLDSDNIFTTTYRPTFLRVVDAASTAAKQNLAYVAGLSVVTKTETKTSLSSTGGTLRRAVGVETGTVVTGVETNVTLSFYNESGKAADASTNLYFTINYYTQTESSTVEYSQNGSTYKDVYYDCVFYGVDGSQSISETTEISARFKIVLIEHTIRTSSGYEHQGYTIASYSLAKDNWLKTYTAAGIESAGCATVIDTATGDIKTMQLDYVYFGRETLNHNLLGPLDYNFGGIGDGNGIRLRLALFHGGSYYVEAGKVVYRLQNGSFILDYNFIESYGIGLNYLYNAADLNIVILLFATIVLLQMLWKVVWGLIDRIYNIVLLFIVMPAFVSMIPIDDGARFNNWKKSLIGKVLATYGVAVGLNIFFVLAPIIKEAAQIFDSGDLPSVLARIPMFSDAQFLNRIVYLLFLLVGFTLIQTAPSLISKLLDAEDLAENGAKVKKSVDDLKKEVRDTVSGDKAQKYMKDFKDNAMGYLPGSAFWGDSHPIENWKKKMADRATKRADAADEKEIERAGEEAGEDFDDDNPIIIDGGPNSVPIGGGTGDGDDDNPIIIDGGPNSVPIGGGTGDGAGGGAGAGGGTGGGKSERLTEIEDEEASAEKNMRKAEDEYNTESANVENARQERMAAEGEQNKYNAQARKFGKQYDAVVNSKEYQDARQAKEDADVEFDVATEDHEKASSALKDAMKLVLFNDNEEMAEQYQDDPEQGLFEHEKAKWLKAHGKSDDYELTMREKNQVHKQVQRRMEDEGFHKEYHDVYGEQDAWGNEISKGTKQELAEATAKKKFADQDFAVQDSKAQVFKDKKEEAEKKRDALGTKNADGEYDPDSVIGKKVAAERKAKKSRDQSGEKLDVTTREYVRKHDKAEQAREIFAIAGGGQGSAPASSQPRESAEARAARRQAAVEAARRKKAQELAEGRKDYSSQSLLGLLGSSLGTKRRVRKLVSGKEHARNQNAANNAADAINNQGIGSYLSHKEAKRVAQIQKDLAKGDRKVRHGKGEYVDDVAAKRRELERIIEAGTKRKKNAEIARTAGNNATSLLNQADEASRNGDTARAAELRKQYQAETKRKKEAQKRAKVEGRTASDRDIEKAKNVRKGLKK